MKRKCFGLQSACPTTILPGRYPGTFPLTSNFVDPFCACDRCLEVEKSIVGNGPQSMIGRQLPRLQKPFHVRDLSRQIDHPGERPGHLAPDLRFVRVGELSLVRERLSCGKSTCERE